jgi:hypothetical protein
LEGPPDTAKLTMKRKLQYILPLIQIMVAAGLIFLGKGQDTNLQDRIHERCQVVEVAYVAPAWHLCDGISGPLRPFWISVFLCDKYSPFSNAWPWIVSMALIALLWYWTGLNLSSWIAKKQLALPSKRFIRLPCDVLIILFGILCAQYALYGTNECGIVRLIHNWHECWHGIEEVFRPVESVMDLAATTCYLMWAVVLIGFFGRDFVKSCAPSVHT